MDVLLRTPGGEMVRVQSGAVRGVGLAIEAEVDSVLVGLALAEARLLGQALIDAADEAVSHERG